MVTIFLANCHFYYHSGDKVSALHRGRADGSVGAELWRGLGATKSWPDRYGLKY